MYLLCINKGELTMEVQVQKWGNSLAIRIPRSFTKEIKIDQGAVMDLSIIDGKLVAIPVIDEKYSLDQLLAKVSEDNLHKDVDTGDPIGREVW
jgi:antitoxin MazE